MWNLLARVLAFAPIRHALIKRAMRTPYTHIVHDGSLYMARYWLFNGYDDNHEKRFPRLPSIRLHNIVRRDEGRHLHSHPWNFRTFILSGGYSSIEAGHNFISYWHGAQAGRSYRLAPGHVHTIYKVEPDTWTLVVIGKRNDEWGFVVPTRFGRILCPHDIYNREGFERFVQLFETMYGNCVEDGDDVIKAFVGYAATKIREARTA